MPVGAKVLTDIGTAVVTGNGSLVGTIWLVGDALGIGTLGAVLLLLTGAAVVVVKAVGSTVGPIVSGTIMGALDAMVGIMDGNDEMRRIVGAIVLVAGPLVGSSTTGRGVLVIFGTRVGLVVAHGTVCVGRVVVPGGGDDDATGGTGSLDSTVGSVETTLATLDGPVDGAGLGLRVVVVGYVVGAWVGTIFPLPLPLPFPILPFFRDDLAIFPRHADMDPLPS
jgi:hypothetical protein